MFRDCHSDLLPTGWGEYSGHHQCGCYNHLRCRHILVMVVFAITQQNVISAAQGLARGQPKFNGTHLTAISIAAHFELVMLRGKKTPAYWWSEGLGAALCVSCIQGRRHGCSLSEMYHIGRFPYKRGKCSSQFSSTRGHNLTLGKISQQSHLITLYTG